MALNPGTKLGPYEILAPLGAGGMGEVYKAKDTRLDRTVAIKVLPSHVASNPEVRQRFEREARAVSSLNHPHICTLYDIGSENGVDFMVMEHIEGDTLADRLKKGALPLDQALRYGIEIADALDKAHRQGVVHRDLKPGNIMLAKSGTKLLDFGLAKLTADPIRDASGLSALPTEVKPLTQEGSILGTFQYMAPEQLEGKEVDARTDIFAFGAVLYEMVTGKKAFEGTSQASLIGAILKDEPPPLTSFAPMSPPALDHVVKSCLTKDPDERCQSAGEVGRNLKWVREAGHVSSVSTPGVSRGGRGRLVGALGGALVATVLSSVVFFALMRPNAPRVSRTSISAPPSQPISLSFFNSDLAISPDGTQIVYVGRAETGEHQLFIRRLDRYEAEALDGTGPDPRNPFFSPDGSWVGYVDAVRPGRLMKVSSLGGLPIEICAVTAHRIRGASWGLDGNIIFAMFAGERGLLRVSASGGEPEVLASPRANTEELYYAWPELLPGGKAVLYTAFSERYQLDTATIEVLSLETGERKTLVSGASNPHYATSGHILYGAQSAVRAMRFDLEQLEVSGTPVSVVERVRMNFSGAVNFDVALDGSFVYISGTTTAIDTPRQLVWVNRDGTEEPIPVDSAAYGWARVSPDGTRLAVSLTDKGDQDVWIHELARGTLSRLTTDPAIDNLPLWTPDGEGVVFASLREGPRFSFFLQAADGTGRARKLVTSEVIGNLLPFAWSRDGNTLVVQYSGRNADIGIVSMEEDPAVQPLIQTEAEESAPSLSPNGAWITYSSDQTGEDEIYVERFPELGRRQQVSIDGGVGALWSPDGRELYYRRGDVMMSVPVLEQGPPLKLGVPTPLFEGRYYQGFGRSGRSYDISPDGTRFLMIKDETTAAPVEIRVVLNWFEELNQLVPTGN